MIRLSLPTILTSRLRKDVRLMTEEQNIFYNELGRKNFKEFLDTTPDWVFPFLDCTGRCGNY